MRSEGAQLLEAIEEVIGVAQEAELPLQISHLKNSRGGKLGQTRCRLRAD